MKLLNEKKRVQLTPQCIRGRIVTRTWFYVPDLLVLKLTKDNTTFASGTLCKAHRTQNSNSIFGERSDLDDDC
jgi:hypothetical protein